MGVSPAATTPASTRQAEARRSVAMTMAPSSRGTPRTSAVWPDTSMLAPRRRSSCTCMKRFSKMVSVTLAAPSAMVFIAMNCACMSVGNAGCGAVRTSTDFSLPSDLTSIQSSPALTLAPASRSLLITASSVSGWARGAFQHGDAFGQRGGHHQVFGAGDGHHVHHDPRALQALALGVDVAVLDADVGPHRLQALAVPVDRARADGAAPGRA